jgi:hypothetical protein
MVASVLMSRLITPLLIFTGVAVSGERHARDACHPPHGL